MNDDENELRDLQFLQETLEKGLFPEWEKDELAALRQIVSEDLTRKRAESQILETTMDNEETKKEASSDAKNGKFIVLAAAQELPAVLAGVKKLGMAFEEVSLGKMFIAHKVIWKTEGEACTLWVCCAPMQRVDAISHLIVRISSLFEPKSVILAGMMGGIPEKIGFLDVLVPTTVYDARILGTRKKKLVVEPEPGSAHPAIHSILNNIAEIKYGETVINVKKNKKSMTVGAKIDDISHDIFDVLRSPDQENIVAYEMEGQALVNANLFQQLDGENIVFGMAKGVADFGGLPSGQNDKEMEEVKEKIGYTGSDGKFDPIDNKIVKGKLQIEATIRAFVVAAEISRRL